MESKVYTIEELRSLVLPLLVKYDMATASLFGSYAKGQANASSDIDLIVTGNPGFRKLNVFGVAEELARTSGKRVDVYESSELLAGSFWDTVILEALPL